MREIKFRAKSKDDGKWVVGAYFKHINRTIGPISDKVRKEDIEHYIVQTVNTDWNLPTRIKGVKVHGDTVGEYTGLKDVKGKEICEGDILICNNNEDDLVEVKIGGFRVRYIETGKAIEYVYGVYYKPIPTDEVSKLEPFCYEMPLTKFYIKRMKAKVIGNIHDNPELTEKQE